MLIARAGAPAIAAALALSSTTALAQSAAAPPSTAAPAPQKPKLQPIVDMSKSPALTGKADAAAPAQQAPKSQPMIGPVDERTAELGGGAIALLALGAGALAISRSRRRRREEAEWQEEDVAAEEHDPLFDEPMFQRQPAAAVAQPAVVAPPVSAFAWGDARQPCDNPADDGSDRCPGESWVERAHRGPSPANPSVSLRARLKRAAFFDKRERDVAAGRAEPVETDAGLPDTMVEEQERELA